MGQPEIFLAALFVKISLGGALMKREMFRHRFVVTMLCLVMSMVSYPAQPVLAEDDYQFKFYTNANVGIV